MSITTKFRACGRHNVSATTHFFVWKRLLSIGDFLDGEASSEDIARLLAARFKGFIKSSDHQLINNAVVVLVIYRGAQLAASGGNSSTSSLEGHISAALAKEFSYKILADVKSQISFDGTDFLRNFSVEYRPSKRVSKLMVSTEQYTDSPTVHRDVFLMTMSDVAVTDQFDITFSYEVDFHLRDMKISDWLSPYV